MAVKTITDEAHFQTELAVAEGKLVVVDKNQCECLNESNDHPMVNALSSSGGHLVSDCDEQLIISITFNQLVKISAIKFKAPPSHGPKKVSVQDLVLGQKDLVSGSPIPLHSVKFLNVQNMQLFVKDNRSGDETTIIDHLAFIGSPIATTKMDDFQRVAGKKGESHQIV
ncbi:thioredoxin-like protein 1 [Topomyia yanbarensis]|uniref:thioredoxin-like protein 1 n=1 Tax=Topomyia yanbarensis TaxID=2498891 RepID=UPI00273AD1D6|nr:thioredoxin-like protein 1 [Topomyia yanbarensis]